jgi:prolipoprotein diacylglyceryl transferase
MMLMQIVWDVDPEIGGVGSVNLRYYGLLFVLGLWLGYQIVKRYYTKEGIELAKLDSLTTYIIIGTLVGARIGHCLFYDWAYYSQHLLEIIIPFQEGPDGWKFTGIAGLASHGGVLGVFIAIFLYQRKFPGSLLSVLDKVSVGAAVTAMFIRLGNLFNSEIIGKATGGDWGFIFKRVDDVARHPTQLYESGSYFLIFLLLFSVYPKKKQSHGFVFGLFFVLLFIARFCIEFFKENQVNFEDGMSLNMGQWLSIPFILAGLSMMWYASRKNSSSPAQES